MHPRNICAFMVAAVSLNTPGLSICAGVEVQQSYTLDLGNAGPVGSTPAKPAMDRLGSGTSCGLKPERSSIRIGRDSPFCTLALAVATDVRVSQSWPTFNDVSAR